MSINIYKWQFSNSKITIPYATHHLALTASGGNGVGNDAPRRSRRRCARGGSKVPRGEEGDDWQSRQATAVGDFMGIFTKNMGIFRIYS